MMTSSKDEIWQKVPIITTEWWRREGEYVVYLLPFSEKYGYAQGDFWHLIDGEHTVEEIYQKNRVGSDNEKELRGYIEKLF